MELSKSGAGDAYAFVVGSPRSGTTILAEVLGRHPAIAYFYEPYFIWDMHYGNGGDDVRRAADATVAARKFIRRELELFAGKSGKPLLIEKTPENCFKIDFIRTIFPRARWIHIIRDGRDCVLSIHRQWLKRQRIVERRHLGGLGSVFKEMMGLQPFWRNRLQAIWFELRESATLDPRHLFNKSKWQGRAGWGPRFADWQRAFEQHDLLTFNALQWRASVQSVRDGLSRVDTQKQIEVRYEDFVEKPEQIIAGVHDFLEVDTHFGTAADIDTRGCGRWRNELDPSEKARLAPIIGELLIELGYEHDQHWGDTEH